MQLLLSNAATTMAGLWRVRTQKPVSVLMAHWVDPGLADPVNLAATEEETALRTHLLGMALQLRQIGMGRAVLALLRHPVENPALRPALLALPGFALWQDSHHKDGPRRFRRGADGLVYRLDHVDAGGASHAEHAISHLAQRLTLDAADASAGVVEQIAGLHCLSLGCALRDVVITLQAAQQDGLVAELLGAADVYAGIPSRVAPGAAASFPAAG